MKGVPEFRRLIDEPKHIAIVMHHRPDADALGASLALAAYLRKKHHQVNVIAPSIFPAFLDWMPGSDEVMVANQNRQGDAAALIQKADIICCLDFSGLDRIHELGDAVSQSDAIKVVIDHHQNPEPFADLYLWDAGSAATAELVYQLIVILGEEVLMDAAMAECLYAGIMTDTGAFKNANTTASSHRITAELIQKGADIIKVNGLIYENYSLNRLKFLGFAISKRLVVLEEFNTAYFTVRHDDFRRFSLQTGDTEGLINHALSIQGIVLAALIKDKKDAVRISLRSSGNIPVNEWAQTHFSGGGHKNAAGGTSSLSLDDAVAKFEAIVKANQHILKP